MVIFPYTSDITSSNVLDLLQLLLYICFGNPKIDDYSSPTV